jgi:hypothetical protein
MVAPATVVRRIRRTAVFAVIALWSRDARAQLSVSGSPAELQVTAATAGSAPVAVSNSNTTYTITAPGTGKHAITASLNTAMPAGVTLGITLENAGGTSASAGEVTLSTIAQDVVTGITKAASSRTITYTLSATAAAGVVPLATRRVTLTLIATP